MGKNAMLHWSPRSLLLFRQIRPAGAPPCRSAAGGQIPWPAEPRSPCPYIAHAGPLVIRAHPKCVQTPLFQVEAEAAGLQRLRDEVPVDPLQIGRASCRERV